ncbi:NAD(P)-binding Rossmann-fold superfamily protein [Wolffia australiana]
MQAVNISGFRPITTSVPRSAPYPSSARWRLPMKSSSDYGSCDFSCRQPLRISSSFSAAAAYTSADGETTLIQSSVGISDLLIVGPGVLGRIIADLWKKDYPGSQVAGQTLTTDHHDDLRQLGIHPISSGSNVEKFPNVIFCAPPSRSADYIADIRSAAACWSGEGSFLFTSSSAIYDCGENRPCDEDSPAIPLGRSRRTDVLLNAEGAVLEAGGCVLRLAGLYKFDRGAHTYWLSKGSDENRPDHLVNLIHYEDAASLSVAILKKNLRSRIFMGCDNHPLSRQEIMDYVNKSRKFDKTFDKFTGTDGPLGKKLDNSKTREEIGWEPKYKSFPFFLGVNTD